MRLTSFMLATVLFYPANLVMAQQDTSLKITMPKSGQQSLNAILWKDACFLYFQQFSRMPIPYDIERPANNLDQMMANNMLTE